MHDEKEIPGEDLEEPTDAEDAPEVEKPAEPVEEEPEQKAESEDAGMDVDDFEKQIEGLEDYAKSLEEGILPKLSKEDLDLINSSPELKKAYTHLRRMAYTKANKAQDALTAAERRIAEAKEREQEAVRAREKLSQILTNDKIGELVEKKDDENLDPIERAVANAFSEFFGAIKQADEKVTTEHTRTLEVQALDDFAKENPWFDEHLEDIQAFQAGFGRDENDRPNLHWKRAAELWKAQRDAEEYRKQQAQKTAVERELAEAKRSSIHASVTPTRGGRSEEVEIPDLEGYEYAQWYAGLTREQKAAVDRQLG